MDSVSQKQNYLSLTGIDQLSENTDDIETLNDTVAILKTQVNALNALVNDEVVQQFVTVTDMSHQRVLGPKTFQEPLQTSGFKCIYDTVMQPSPIVFYSPEYERETNKQQCRMVFDARQGVSITGGKLILDANSLEPTMINGIVPAFQNIINNSITTTTANASTVNVSGTLKVQNATSTCQLLADNATFLAASVTNELKVGKLTIKSSPILNITIPFQPAYQDAVTTVGTTPATFTTAYPISFFAGAGSNIGSTGVLAQANAMLFYQHPTNYYIAHIGMMCDSDTLAATTTYKTSVILDTYKTDWTTKLSSNGLATFTVNNATRTGMYTFGTPILVEAGTVLSGSHLYTGAVPPFKECYYTIYGYQA